MAKIVPDMEKPAGPSEAFDLQFHDGNTRRVYITDFEYHLSNSGMIFSRSDLEGKIIQTNITFLEASGWEKEDLIGKPHYILRHPHMPKAAFTDFWDTLKKGDQWTGYVKNLRKDGGFYWVRAVVSPIFENDKIVGYNSVRKKADAAAIKEYEALYADMRAKEAQG